MKGKPIFKTINREEFLADLGKVTDADIARKYGLFYRTVMVYRKKYGIGTFANERIPSFEELNENIKKYPNTELVRIYGVGLHTISKWRGIRGLANVWQKNVVNKERFIKDAKIMRLKELMGKYCISRTTCGYWKKKYGLTTGKAENRKITWGVDGDGCWICTSHKLNDKGYPQCKQEKLVAKRMWIEKNGPWPEGKSCVHICDNKLCINPDHVISGTMVDNQAGMAERNRSPWGDRCGARKLNSDEAKEIYALKNSGISQYVVGKKYGVNGTTIWAIWTDKTWWRDNQGMENFPVLLTKKIVGKKLTLREVESVRSMKGKLSLRKTAKLYKISHRMVFKIWNNMSWVAS
jgi:hypothetical protein